MSEKMNCDTIYVMGVTSCGKSTVGEALAKRIGWDFKDGDSFHPVENIEKMRNGIPLNDEDRYQWLVTINSYANSHPNCVIACSSLKLKYRKLLSERINAVFFLLQLERKTLEKRLLERTGHFMSPLLLNSQLDTLEMPEGEETKIVKIIDANTGNADEIVNDIVKFLN